MGEGLGQAIGPRGARARHDVEGRPPEDARRRSEPARDRHGPEGERPRRSGGETAPRGDAPEHGDVDEVVAPEIEDGAAARLDELESRQLAVAAVEDRVGQEEKRPRSEEHTSELQSRFDLVCRLLLEKKKKKKYMTKIKII